MQTIKIVNYEREHGPGTFAPFRDVTAPEADAVREALRRCLDLPEGASPKDVVLAIQARSVLIPDVNAEDEAFDLGRLLDQLHFHVPERIYLNWHHFDEMDEMLTRDVIMSFSDIWYPSADDVELIDSNMQWVLLIHHFGAVSALDLAAKK